MSEGRPLHVRTAEALGWTDCESQYAGSYFWYGVPWSESVHGKKVLVPRFPEDWRETGPLIQTYGIQLLQSVKISDPPERGSQWYATLWNHNLPGEANMIGMGETALVAVCNLILALTGAGKLLVMR